MNQTETINEFLLRINGLDEVSSPEMDLFDEIAAEMGIPPEFIRRPSKKVESRVIITVHGENGVNSIGTKKGS